MKQKLLAALEQRYGGTLGSKNEIYEKVVTAYGNLITSEEQIPDIAAGVEPLLKQYQSVNDKLRTLERKNEQTPSSDTGGDPEPKPEPPKPEQPDFAKMVADAVSAAIKPLSDKLAAFETEQNAKSALQGAESAFRANEYVGKYKDEANDAWERASEMYEATGKTWTAEQLQEKAMGYFNKAVSRKGVDTTQPFPSDGGANNSSEESNKAFAAEIKAALGIKDDQ